MSSQKEKENASASPSFVTIVLVITFFITFAITSFGNFPIPLVEADDEASVAVVKVATDTPPTATIAPTSHPTNTPTIAPTATTPPTREPTAEPTTVVENQTTSSTSDYDPDVVAHGQSLFLACGACHGQDGLGLPNLGKPLVDSEFVDSTTDKDLVTFIKTGRPIWDPLNTTGIDMPAKGGNPTLTDEDMFAIVAYIRSLNQ